MTRCSPDDDSHFQYWASCLKEYAGKRLEVVHFCCWADPPFRSVQITSGATIHPWSFNRYGWAFGRTEFLTLDVHRSWSVLLLVATFPLSSKLVFQVFLQSDLPKNMEQITCSIYLLLRPFSQLLQQLQCNSLIIYLGVVYLTQSTPFGSPQWYSASQRL